MIPTEDEIRDFLLSLTWWQTEHKDDGQAFTDDELGRVVALFVSGELADFGTITVRPKEATSDR